MPRVPIELSETEERVLKEALKHHERAYVRERASAILKVAKGISRAEVARSQCLQARKEETVGRWIKRFKAHGITGLLVAAGRGKKPAVPPSGKSRSSRTSQTQSKQLRA